MIYLILGGPASGKGTRSKILAQNLKIPHISTGDLLRKEGETNSSIQEILDKGLHVCDEVITGLLYKRICEVDCLNGFVLDGYPRNVQQVKLLEDMLDSVKKKVSICIELVVSDEVVFKRILGRKQCKECGKIYGSGAKEKFENVCDDCSGEVIRRSDDNKKTLEKRLKLYKRKSKPIIDYYKNRGKHAQIDSSCEPERILTVSI